LLQVDDVHALITQYHYIDARVAEIRVNCGVSHSSLITLSHSVILCVHIVCALQISYDRVAEEYVKRIFEELAHKPLDRALLDRFAEQVSGLSPACDVE
jgi:hypothetical protein